MRISDWSSDVCSSDLISARHCRGRGRHQPGAKADPRAGLDRCRIAVGKGDADPEAGMLALIDQRDPRHASPDKPLDTFHLAGDGCGNRPIEPGRSEEHTSELQSLMRISYAVFCLKKKTKHTLHTQR